YQYILYLAVAHAHLADLQVLGIDDTVDLVAEELPEARRVDVLRRQHRLVQVGPGPGIVVVIREDVRASGRRRRRRQRAEQAVRLVVEAGGEVHRVGVAATAAVADLQRPQP